MLLRLSIIGVLGFPILASGCNGGDVDLKDDDTGGSATDDTGGGGTGTSWRASGEGTAYFLDGTEDNSLFHLELTRCTEPAEGEAYYGWVSKAGEGAIAVGEITVAGEEVYFESDIGVNAIIQGFDRFEAWANDSGVQGEGTALWTGQVDPVIYDTIQGLLIASEATPDGEGSLRAVETSVEVIRNSAVELLAMEFDMDTFQAQSEAIANSLEGEMEDRDNDGSIDMIDGQLGILNTGGYIELIIADFDEATLQVDPGDPIKDYINYAVDCTQSVRDQVELAVNDADAGSVCLEETSCENRLDDVVTELGYALDGQDLNEDGDIDDLANPTEGALTCAIAYVAQMAQMTVETP